MSRPPATALHGDWDLDIRTPVGSMAVRLHVAPDGEGSIGTASGRGETVPLQDIHATPEGDGVRAMWTQQISKPVRLTLRFDVVVRGDVLTGVSKAGRLPSSRVDGRRATSAG